jgi:MFS family permease
MNKGKYVELFKDKNFAFFWIGVLGFGLGNAIFFISLNWWVLIETNSEVQLGIVNTLYFLPMVILCLFSGIITDIFNRLKLMIFSLVLRGIIILILPILQVLQIIELWHIYVSVFIQGLSFPFFLNSINAIMPEIIKRDNLLPANALVDSAMWISNLFGYFFGGFLISSLGFVSLFLISAYILIFGGLIFFPIKYVYLKRSRDLSLRGVLSDINNGYKVMKKDSVLLLFILSWMVIYILFANGPMSIGWPVFSERILSAGSEGYGILVAAISASSLIGSLAIGHWGSKFKKGKLSLIGYLWGGIGILIFTFTSNLLLAAIILFFWSFYYPMINVSYWTAMQERVPQQDLGKITGFSWTLTSIISPVSTMITGYIMEFISIILPFILLGFSFILCFFIILSHKESRSLV